MKQVAQNYRSGELTVLDVPAPACKPGGVLVRSLFSLISTGTEMMKVSEARLSLLGKAKARPDQVRKLMDSVASQGAVATYQKAMNKLDSYTPLGYSLCGVVVEVGVGAEEFQVGQLVAAAGNEFALHAEVNWVPVNLCVPVPDGVAAEHAAFATVGAIAMQGVRRAEPALGETACVIGLGLIGQLVVRLLVAAGVQVVGLDTVAERCRTAEKAGALACAAPDEEGMARIEQVLVERTGRLGDGGADHILLAAGGDSNGPVEAAARLARDRGRVVDIGKTRLDLPWNAYYDKELDVRFSRSYGPGRYDDRYELDGIDYPSGYVRWTERRNLGCFLDLLAAGSIDVTDLVSGVHPIAEASGVYERIGSGELTGVGFLLSYPEADDEPAPGRTLRATTVPAVTAVPAPRRGTGALRIGFIGAGNYATSMLLPHLHEATGVDLVSVATTRSLSAMNAQRKFGFSTVTTDADEVLDDDSLDAVFVVTRHHSHAAFVTAALERGGGRRAVFVEKPLALDENQIRDILATVERTGNDRIMVGFNRRFAPLVAELREHFGLTGSGVEGPLAARYLINAGHLEATSWYLDADRQGSRFAGEGGHFIDTVSALIGQNPNEAYASGGGDDVQAVLGYPDGSTATIAYLTGGSPRFGKETIDLTGGGRSARLDNFGRTTVWTPNGKHTKRSLTGVDKGQKAQLAAFVRAVRGGSSMPIGLDSLVATTRATLAVGTSLAERRPVTW